MRRVALTGGIGVGINDEKRVSAVPLAPRFLFLATPDQATLELVAAQGQDALAKRLNKISIEQAARNVCAAHEGHLRFVEKHLRR